MWLQEQLVCDAKERAAMRRAGVLLHGAQAVKPALAGAAPGYHLYLLV
jgi:hypothetical protein